MAALAEAYPDDIDVQALAADALVNVTAWALWDTRTGEPAPGSRVVEAKRILDDALATPAGRAHPGVLHLYLHTMEMSATPAGGAARRGSAARPGARRRTPAAHAQPHRRAVRRLPRLGGGESGCGAGRSAFRRARGTAELLLAVPRAQPALRGVFGDVRRQLADRAAGRRRTRRAADARTARHRVAADGGLAGSVRAVAGSRAGAVRPVGRADRQAAARRCRPVLHHGRDHPLRPRCRARRQGPAAAGARRARGVRRGYARIPETRYLFNNTVRDILAIAAEMLDGEIAYREGRFDDAFAHCGAPSNSTTRCPTTNHGAGCSRPGTPTARCCSSRAGSRRPPRCTPPTSDSIPRWPAVPAPRQRVEPARLPRMPEPAGPRCRGGDHRSSNWNWLMARADVPIWRPVHAGSRSRPDESEETAGRPSANAALRRLRPVAISDDDLERLRRCVELAREALDDGDEPFGSMLVDGDGTSLFEDRNRVKDGDATRHPEFAIARWAATTCPRRAGPRDGVHLRRALPDVRGGARVGWARPHRVRHVVRAADQWLAEWGAPPPPVAPLPITTWRPASMSTDPHPNWRTRMKALYEAKFRRRAKPAWVQHAIWWQVYPLGFVGAYPADPPPPADEHRLRRVVDWLDHAIELGASGLALGPIFASRPTATTPPTTTGSIRGSVTTPTSTSWSPRRSRRGSADPARRRLQPRRHRLRADAAWFRGAAARQRVRHLRGPRRADRAEPRQPRGRRLHRRRDDALAGPRRRRLAAGRRLRGPRPVLGAGAAPGAASASRRLVRRGGHPRRLLGAGARRRFDSVTQYELWKAIWSSLNDGNFHELDWALARHDEFLDAFVPMTFVGNHDVTRIASQLDEHPAPRTRAGDPVDHGRHPERLRRRRVGLPRRQGGAVRRRRRRAARIPRAPEGVDEHGHDVFRLHQYLIGLRRRHPWLHTARTSPLRLTNTQYVYRDPPRMTTRCWWRSTSTMRRCRCRCPNSASVEGQIVAGSGAPPQRVVGRGRGRAARLADHRAAAEQLHGGRVVLAAVELVEHRAKVGVVVRRAANSVIDDRSLRLSGQPKMSSAERPSIAATSRAHSRSRGPSTSCAR